jgi:hypothetical protein
LRDDLDVKSAPQSERVNKSGHGHMRMISNAPAIPSSSPGIDRLLGRYVLRNRLVSLVRAIGVAVAVFLAVMIAELILDRLFALARPVRVIVFAIDATVIIGIVVPRAAALVRRFNPVAAAIAIESRTPAFDQRLVTVVSQPGTGLLIDQLRRDVECLIEQRDVHPRLEIKPLLQPWVAGLVMSLLFALLWTMPRMAMPSLLSRFVHPLEDIAPATATRLTVRPGDIAVPEDKSVTVSVTVESQTADQPLLHLSDDGRTWTVWPMVRSSSLPAVFNYSLPAIDREWKYFVTSGDATSRVCTLRQSHVPV